MTSPDIVERLRAQAAYDKKHYPPGDPLHLEAASEIDANRAEISRLREEVAALGRHAGEEVTWDRLVHSHSGMLGLEPWRADNPNEGHRVYRQGSEQRCYMCAALAMVERVKAENDRLRALVGEVDPDLEAAG